jgi:DNA-binding beta-propeller fold protein YncE
MKRTLALITPVLLVSALLAQTPHYRQTATFTVGGQGGWDYVTYDPVQNRLFIAHNDAVLVVDASSGKELGRIPANGAHGVALVQDENRGYSSNGRAGNVTAFDLKTLKTIGDIKAGENPDAIIYDPHSRRVVVMNGRSHDLMAIDPKTSKVVADVTLGGKLEFAAADAHRLYVNVEDKNELAAVNSTSWKEEQRWKLADCEDPGGLALDLQSHRLFAACGNRRMLVVNSDDGKVVATLPTGEGTDAAAFDPELKLAFASNGEGTLTVIKESGVNKYQVVENVKTQRGARTMALDPKSHRVFLVTADLGEPAPGQRRPTINPGTFRVLVYSPE